VYCPECGHDAGEAKFCPECGADLNAVRAARAGQRPAKGGGRAAPQAGARQPDGRAGTARRPPRPPDGRRSLLPVLLWAGVGLVAVVVVVTVLLLGVKSGHRGSAGPAARPHRWPPDTSGSYRELVSRANGLYDQAAAAAQINDMAAAQRYGKAAAAVYAAAWSKQPGDPSVGTDWAHVLFFAGEFQAPSRGSTRYSKPIPASRRAGQQGRLLWNLAQMTTDQSQAAQYSAQAKAALPACPASRSCDQTGSVCGGPAQGSQ